MSSVPLRRVRKLRLSAPSESMLRRGALLVEDALRTITVPGIEKGQLLIVRSLNLTKIRVGHAPASVALIIENSLTQLSANAVHGADAGAARQRVVYFRNEVEAHVCLAVKLARDEDTNNWFWPLAVPVWRPNTPRDEALRSILYAVMGTGAGVMSAVAMISELKEQRAVDVMLAALRRQDGPGLLRASNWSIPSPAGVEAQLPKGDTQATLGRWGAVLARWAGQWGGADERTTWLAAVALAAENPGRLLDPRLSVRAQGLIALLTTRACSHPDGSADSAEHGSDFDVMRNTPRKPPRPSFDSEENQTKEVPPTSERPFHQSEVDQWTNNSIAIPPDERNASHLLGGPSRDVSAETTKDTRPDRHESSQDSRDVEGFSHEASWTASAKLAKFAGLFFLIPVMSRLGIRKMLTSHPALIEINLPERLLHMVAQRLGISDDDSAAAMLTAGCREEASTECEFSVSANWVEELCRPGPLIVRRSSSGARVLSDASGKLALALWRGRVPEAVRALVGGASLKRELRVLAERDVDILLDSWLTAMRRWCRRYTKVGLSDLVRRRGRVAVTRTHIDVFFDYRQADVRVRKAGLDIDPGWVDWYGRVATFHYLEGRESDGK